MGTANFHAKNANDMYVIYDRYFDEDDGHEVYRDWRDIKEDVTEYGLVCGWDKVSKSFRFGGDYDTSVLCKEFWFEYSNSGYRYRVDAYITINAGYYESCNLDYRFVLDGMSDDTDVADMREMIVEDFVDVNNCYPLSYTSSTPKCWNDGLRKMQRKNFEKALDEFLGNVVGECERFCENACDDTWKAICHASNGECFYEKVG